MKKEEAKAGVRVDVEKDGEHETGVIVAEPTSTGLVKVLLLGGQVVVRHVDRLSLAS